MVKYSLFDQLARDTQDIEDIRVFLLYVTTLYSNHEKEDLEKLGDIVSGEIEGTSKRRKDNNAKELTEELERKEKNGSIERQDLRTFYLREYVELLERRKTTLLAWAVGYQNLLVIFPT